MSVQLSAGETPIFDEVREALGLAALEIGAEADEETGDQSGFTEPTES